MTMSLIPHEYTKKYLPQPLTIAKRKKMWLQQTSAEKIAKSKKKKHENKTKQTVVSLFSHDFP